MLASLPMYDLPEVRNATNALWKGLRERLGSNIARLPLELDRTRTREAQWRDPELVFSQTCGYPLRMHFREHLRVLGAPRYSAEGCEGHDYSSAFVAHDNGRTDFQDFRNAVIAVNGVDSQSGYNVVKATLHAAQLESTAGQPFFGHMKISGTHRASIAMVQCGDADIAAIDAVSLALIRAHAPAEFEGLTVVHHSPPAPSLPWVTSTRVNETTVASLRDAIAAMLADPTLAAARDALHLRGFDNLDMDEYERIDAMTQASGNLVLAPEDFDAS